MSRLTADDVLVDQYREKVLSKGEELFVKNLENVQGDERDIILISMTYGPEPGTRAVKQRFGPINRKQGHRRLNVLFSRARKRIGLFCSFGSADVVVGPDSSEGVRVLQKYLEFAETKGRVSFVQPTDREPDSDFECEVADRLRAKGYVVDYQVGVSGYRIDLGVRHPDHSAQYLAGIECDGAAYHSSKSARDRDRLREEVLNDKGWEILRVWSTDWFDNPALQTDRLVQKLESLRARPADQYEDYSFSLPDRAVERGLEGDAHGGDPIESGLEVSSPLEANVILSNETVSPGEGPISEAECFVALKQFRDQVIALEMSDWEPHRSILRDAMIETFIRQRFVESEDWFDKVPGYLRQGTSPAEKGRYLDWICTIVDRISSTVGEGETNTELTGSSTGQGGNAPNPRSQDRSSSSGEIAYSPTNFSVLSLELDPSKFYDREYGSVLGSMVDHVIKTESPIYEDLLVVRIARAHGFQRAGERIQKTLSGAIGKRYRKTQDDDRSVLWHDAHKADSIVTYRSSQPEVRSHVDVPIAELASLAVPFLRLRLADEDVLYRMAERFELGRLREATRSRFQAAVHLAKQKLQNGVR